MASNPEPLSAPSKNTKTEQMKVLGGMSSAITFPTSQYLTDLSITQSPKKRLNEVKAGTQVKIAKRTARFGAEQIPIEI